MVVANRHPLRATCSPLLVFLFILFCGSAAHAQYEKRPAFFLSGGAAIPRAPDWFGDQWKMGFNGGCGVEYVLMPHVAVTGSFAYHRFRFDEEGFLSEVEIGGPPGVEVRIKGDPVIIYTVTAGAKVYLFRIGSYVSPYASAGMGYFYFSSGGVEFFVNDIFYPNPVANKRAESGFAMYLGVGVDVNVVENIFFFIEPEFLIGYTEHENTRLFPVKAGFLIIF